LHDLRDFRFNHLWSIEAALTIQAGGRILLRHCGGIVPALFKPSPIVEIFKRASKHWGVGIQSFS
jgi:hypothetical protein